MFVDFPTSFTWNKSSKAWAERKNRQSHPTVGRVHSVLPSAGELYYLRILLHNEHCRGKRSFAELREVNGVQNATYQETCRSLGLLQDDQEWDRAMHDAARTQMCPEMRALFVTLLEFCEPSDPTRLFESHWEAMGEDLQYKFNGGVPREVLRTMVLLDVERRLQAIGKELANMHLPEVEPRLRVQAVELDESFRTERLPMVLLQELDMETALLLKLPQRLQAVTVAGWRLIRIIG